VDGPPPPASKPLSVVTFSVTFYGPVENLTHTVDVHTKRCRDSREVPPTSLEVAAVSSMVHPSATRSLRIHLLLGAFASKAVFSFKFFYKIGIIPISFVFDKYYPIMY
jgi:hypothetical protein